MSRQAVPVHVNRRDQGSIETPAEDVETARSLRIVLENHGEPTHVHCRVTGDLAPIASVPEPNPYIERAATVEVPVEFAPGVDRATGTIELSTRFGAESASLPVTLARDEKPETQVAVDDRLAEPPGGDDPGEPADTPLTRLRTLFGPETAGLTVLAAFAMVLAVIAAVVVGGTAGTLGLAIVLAGILVAFALLLS